MQAIKPVTLDLILEIGHETSYKKSATAAKLIITKAKLIDVLMRHNKLVEWHDREYRSNKTLFQG